jgi:CBS domain containing-hemolysin-like protein
MLTVRDANRQLHLDLPEDGSYTTLAGFLMAQAGHLPNEGVVEYLDSTFKIERLEGRRIRRVRLTQNAGASLQVAGKGAT